MFEAGKKDLEGRKESEGKMKQNSEGERGSEGEKIRQGPGRMQIMWGLGRVMVKKGPGFHHQVKCLTQRVDNTTLDESCCRAVSRPFCYWSYTVERFLC